MSQSIGTRIEVLGTLTCLGPVHVGGWDTTVDADLAVARDGSGRPFLPGTSLAGAIRAYLSGIDGFAGAVNDLFGHTAAGTQDGSASWIRIDDAHLIDADSPLAVRDGVGIDRRSASAAEAYLFTRQVLVAGTRFTLRLLVDTPTAAAAPAYTGGWPALIRDAVDTTVAGLAQARIPIGAGRGRGHGRVALSDVRIRRADLSDPAGLIAWLTGSAPAVPYVPAVQVGPPADGKLQIVVAWRPVTALLVRDSMPGTVVDTLPLTALHTDGTVRLLLPGSSIRGAARAHAERITRTLCRQDAPADFGDGLRRPPAGVAVLFGTAPAAGHTEGDGRGRRGVLCVEDCHSLGRVGAADWNTVLTTTPAGVVPSGQQREDREQRNVERDTARGALGAQLQRISPDLALQVSDHVAVDRWTGGAADHRLFSVLDPQATTTWEPIRISVDVPGLRRHRSPDGVDPSLLALPLLLLVLRDLQDGWLSLGYGGTRGRGQIEVSEVTFDGAGLTGPWRSLAGRTLAGVLADPPPEVADAMTAWAAMFEEPQ